MARQRDIMIPVMSGGLGSQMTVDDFANTTGATIANKKPLIATAPVITGTITKGTPITWTPGTYTAVGSLPVQIETAIFRDGSPVTKFNTTGTTYTPIESDKGSMFQVVEIGNTSAGYTANNSSAAVQMLPAVARWPAPSPVLSALLDFIAGDGATQQPFLQGAAIYNSGTNSTWITRQRIAGDGTRNRVASISVVNHTTGVISSYDGFIDGEQQDGHGGTSLCRLPSGYWQLMGGVHGASYFKYAVTATPDDPSSFVDQGNVLGGGSLALTYPEPSYFDGNLFVFARNTLSNTAPYGYIKASSISASGVPTFPTTHTAVIDMGTNSRTYAHTALLSNGYEVAIATCYTDFNNLIGQRNVYVAVLNTRTNMVRNMANTASTAAPATKTWLDANCLLVDQISAGKFNGVPTIGVDVNGNPFVGYFECAAYNLPPVAIKEIHWTGSAWSAPATLYTSTTTTNNGNQFAFVAFPNGSVDAYFTTDAPAGFARGGNMSKATYTPGAGWSGSVVVKAATIHGMCNAVAVINGNSASRVVFGEAPAVGAGSIEPTIYGGNTRRFLVNDAGLVTRSNMEDATATAYFNQFNSPPAAASNLRLAINDLVTELKRMSAFWNSLDFFYILANQDEQSALINLRGNTAFNATKSGTIPFTPFNGYNGNGSGFINSNFNPSVGTPNYALNSAQVGMFSLNDVNTGAIVLGSFAGSGGGGTYGRPKQTNGYPILKMNAQFGTQSSTAINRTDGLMMFVRNGVNNQASVADGQYFGSGDTSVSTIVPQSALTLLGDNNAGIVSNAQVAIWFAGAHTGFENYQIVANIIRRYLYAVGNTSVARNERQQLVNSVNFASGFFNRGGNLTVTAGRSDPFGGTTAFRLQASATTPSIANTTLSQVAQVDPAIQDNGLSGYFNNNTCTMWVRSDTPGQSIMTYDGTSYTAIAITSNWTRVAWTTLQAYHTFLFCSYNGTANQFSDIDVYGPQIDPGSTAGVYKATS